MKNVERPAILGNKPSFEDLCHIVSPVLPDVSSLVTGINQVQENRYITNQGPFVGTLESKIADMIGVKYCASFCNGTIALITLLKALDIKGEVILPSFTFAATAQAALWCGLNVKFADVSRDDFLMDAEKVEREISENTSAILPVNLFGECCDFEVFERIAKKHNLPLVYDSAQAFGVQSKGRFVGSFGDAEVFSFHATKVFHTCEGGAILTNNSELYEKICLIRNFGFSSSGDSVALGLNGKMSELHAVVGLRFLEEFPKFLEQRKSVFACYERLLQDIPGISLLKRKVDTDSNYSYLCVLVDPEYFGLSNVELKKALEAERILTRTYFNPSIHEMSFYKDMFPDSDVDLPNTHWAGSRLLTLPVHVDMTEQKIEDIVNAIRSCHVHAKEIKEHFN